jgi:hypothetical protein
VRACAILAGVRAQLNRPVSHGSPLLQRRSLTRAILAALTRSRQTHDTGDSASRSATGIEVHAIVGGGNMGTLRTLFKVE